MKTKIFIGLVCFLLLGAFTFIKNINPLIPKEFPQPVYDFKKNPVTEEGFQLGRRLFYDPILSSDSTISCANCHQQFSAFSNVSHPLSHGVKGALGKRNSPALQNLIWNTSFMWDGGVLHMELQPISPITNKLEMNETLDHVITKLQRNESYRNDFKKVFGENKITTQSLSKALSQYMAMLISSNSKYDAYIRGDATYTASEERGMALFREKCATCHKEPLFTDYSFRNNGLKPNDLVPDSGRIIITGAKKDAFLFKVPSLRNIAVTSPYMHDGRFTNLQQVLEHYKLGIYESPTLDSTLAKSVILRKEDISDIISFLKTLTDRDFLFDKRFYDPTCRNNFLNDVH